VTPGWFMTLASVESTDGFTRRHLPHREELTARTLAVPSVPDGMLQCRTVKLVALTPVPLGVVTSIWPL